MLLNILNLCVFTSFVTADLTSDYINNLISQTIADTANYTVPLMTEGFDSSSKIQYYDVFDFIVIGAGTAGCVVATRLSEISNITILLLEAGDEQLPASSIPALANYLEFTKMNYGYKTIPQRTSCLGKNGRQCTVQQGKGIGGTSSIDSLWYNRGNRKDFKKWSKYGKWSYQDVLPFFIKSENSQIDGDETYHGKGGFWNVEYDDKLLRKAQIFLDAYKELNYPYDIDLNGKLQLGAGKLPFSNLHGARQSTGTAYLLKARKRSNLKVLTRAFVTKIRINSQTLAATGVEFSTPTQRFYASARREVILSAGAINSPKILKLSGVGPRQELENFKISVILDLPAVGQNLREHPIFTGLYIKTNDTGDNSTLETDIKEYIKGYGNLTRVVNTQAYSLINTNNNTENVPATEHVILPFHYPNPSDGNFNATIHQVLNNVGSKADSSILIILLQPKSLGQVTLKSSNPFDFPLIDFRMFEEEEDLDNMIAGIHHTLTLLNTKAFRNINATVLDIPICTENKPRSRDYWICVLKTVCEPIGHSCGTTTMGSHTKRSVVDGSLRVHGIRNLRVVDAGVFPAIPSGHLTPVVMMIAEKISYEMIKQYA